MCNFFFRTSISIRCIEFVFSSIAATTSIYSFAIYTLLITFITCNYIYNVVFLRTHLNMRMKKSIFLFINKPFFQEIKIHFQKGLSSIWANKKKRVKWDGFIQPIPNISTFLSTFGFFFGLKSLYFKNWIKLKVKAAHFITVYYSPHILNLI